MMNIEQYRLLILVWLAFALVLFLVLLKVTAPYGRHSSAKWGPRINNNLGWVIMESPGIILVLYFMFSTKHGSDLLPWIPVIFYVFHYLNRTLVFPFRLHTRKKKMPILIMFSAILFNLINGFFLGYYFAHFASYAPEHFTSLSFIAGVVLFVSGMIINWQSDNLLIHLRKPDETGYKIPHGRLFKYVSCPNHLGEIVEWTGFALLSWNLAALSFLIWTIANLLPRALSHHRWYKSTFHNYPADRKAIIPFIL